MSTIATRKKTSYFDRLCELQPAIRDLYEEARNFQKPAGETYCQNAVFFGTGPWKGKGFKDRLVRLVGWDAGLPSPAPKPLWAGDEPISLHVAAAASLVDLKERAASPDDYPIELTTSAAYDCAYRAILNALPACSPCDC